MESSFYKSVPNYKSIIKKSRDILQNQSIKSMCIGKTVLERDIPTFSIGSPNKAILYVGGFHPQEWLTVLAMFRLLEDISSIITNETDLTKALSTRGVIIVPCINIDGMELVANGFESAGCYRGLVEEISGGDLSRWNANIKGVDINHNFDAGYDIVKQMEMESGITKPSPRQYGGQYAESEPETRSLTELCIKYDISRVMAFHSQGEEIYYHYGDNTPSHSRQLADIFAKSSGYEVLHPSGMASHGGFKDWFIEKTGKPGFTIEIGNGQNPLPVEDFQNIYDRIFEMMILGIVI